MAEYVYRATDRTGNLVDGTMEGRDERAVVDRLQELGYLPISVELPQATDGLSRELRFGNLLGRITQKDIVNFTNELSALLDAGFPLERGLTTLTDLSGRPRFQKVVHDLVEQLRGGATFSDTLARHPRVFSRLYVNMVRAGEAGGVLDLVLERLSQFLEDTQELKEYIGSALVYPVLLTLVGGGAIAMLLTLVIPKFAQIFADQGQALPLPTLIMLNISEVAVRYWWAILAAIAAGVLALRSYAQTTGGRLAVDRALLQIPVFGTLIQKIQVARFARTLGTLIHNGVPLLQSLAIVQESLTNRVLSDAIAEARQGVEKGANLSEPLRQTSAFPLLFLHMLAVGEETGSIEAMLLKVAETYDRQVKSTLKSLVALIEPVMILVMGGLVGFIVFSMLLAIFSLNELPL